MKRVKRSAFVIGILTALTLMPSNAFADEIVNFYLVATTNVQPSGADASGTVTIDTTTGVIDAIDLSFAGQPDSLGPPSTGVYPWGLAPYNFVGFNEYRYSLDGSAFYDIEMWLPVVSLVGYTGGPICSTENPCYGGPRYGNIDSGYAFVYSDGYVYTSGDLEPTPEPSSLLLLLTGALGIGAILSRTKAQSTAERL
jgi:hypothetical protein